MGCGARVVTMHSVYAEGKIKLFKLDGDGGLTRRHSTRTYLMTKIEACFLQDFYMSSQRCGSSFMGRRFFNQ